MWNLNDLVSPRYDTSSSVDCNCSTWGSVAGCCRCHLAGVELEVYSAFMEMWVSAMYDVSCALIKKSIQR